MAGRLKLLALLTLGVLVAHALAIDWLWSAWMPVRPMQRMADVMFTRTLAPAEPPAVAVIRPPAPRPKPRPAIRQVSPQPAAEPASAPENSPVPLPEPETAAQASAPPATSTATSTAASIPTAATAPTMTTVAGSATATVAASATPTSPLPDPNASLRGWPPDTRLRYQLTGFWRGDVTGAARVQWQRDADRYQVEIAINLGPGINAVILSQGKVTPAQLEPLNYEEVMPFGRRRPIQFRDRQIRLADGEMRERPEAVQDTASQFVEMAYRFSRDPALLAEGSVVRLTMARPGGIDHWVYDVAAPEIIDLRLDHVHTPVVAYRLKPRPLPGRENYIYMQVWYSPQLQNLPVRIRVDLGDEKGHVQLDVIGIDQR